MTLREQMRQLMATMPTGQQAATIRAVAECSHLGSSLGITRQSERCAGAELYECLAGMGLSINPSTTSSERCVRCRWDAMFGEGGFTGSSTPSE